MMMKIVRVSVWSERVYMEDGDNTTWGKILDGGVYSAYVAQNYNVLRPLEQSCLNSTLLKVGAPISFYWNDTYFAPATHMLNGWKMWTEWTNYEAGGIDTDDGNYMIELMYIEDFSDIVHTEIATEYALNTHQSDFIFGPYSTRLTESCLSVTDALNATVISAGSVVESVYESSDHAIGLLPAAYKYTETAFAMLGDLGAQTVAVIVDNDVPLCANSTASLYSAVYNLTMYGHFTVDTTSATYSEDVSNILSELKDNNVEAVLGCSFESLCKEIPVSAKALDYNPSGIIFAVCSTAADLPAEIGVDAAYIFGITPWSPTPAIKCDYTGWTALEFSDRYMDTYGIPPSYHAAATFAGGLILRAAIESTSTINSTVVGDAIRRGIYQTIYGNVSFNEHGQSVANMMTVQMQPDSLKYEVVWPDKFAITDIVYPVPTWAQRACSSATADCDSHGQCNANGTCVCDFGYYGYENVDSCDTYCIGTFHPDTGACTRSTTYYIGILSDYQYPDAEEYRAQAKLAAAMINDKNDGWFDDDVMDITLFINFNDSECSQEGGYLATKGLNHWALDVSGSTLGGIVGGYCSGASKAASIYGNTIYAPQISYASTAVDLSNKDTYHYFARTCASDDVQGPAIVYALEDLGVVPFVAVIYTLDDYPTSLANAFTSSYIAAGYTILLQYSYDSTSATSATYDAIISRIASSGSPVIVLIMYEDQVDMILSAAKTHPVLSSDKVVWVGVDAWTDIRNLSTPIPFGTIGLSPHQPTTGITSDYLSVWESLDPVDYPDADGDRSGVAPYSLNIVDAVVSLAKAFQQSLDDNTGLSGDVLKQYVYTVLTRDVTFDGVSGSIDFSASGDLVTALYGFKNYKGAADGTWERTGSVGKSSIDLNYTSLIWPDGSVGKTTSYSQQLSPYCPAGEESVASSASVFVCSPCEVGMYKPYAGTQSCTSCPEGADCNNVGITVPCVMKGYWRDVPKLTEDMGNFQKYKIYSCDFTEVCEGGCILNATCHHDRKQSSVMCGECRSDRFMSDGQCYACGDSSSTLVGRLMIYLSSLFFMSLVLAIMVVSLVYRIGSSTASSFAARSSSLSETPNNTLPRHRAILQKASRSVSEAIISPAIAMLTHYENQRKVKKVIKGSGMTAKITISFLQVMTGAFFVLDLDWPNYLYNFFSTVRINPFRKIQESLSCTDSESVVNPVFFGVCFSTLVPIGFALLLIISSLIAWKLYRCTKAGRALTQKEATRQWTRLRDLSVKIYLWFCLISYPPLSQRLLAFFNCRDLGISGVYLRDDYSVSCESVEYSRFFYVALLGVALVPIGIPVFFCMVIHHRFHPLLRNPSLLLHDNFAVEWRYYEVYDLIRKLLLTSLVVYIAPPDTASQCLYLLLVDTTALVLLAYSRPYANGNDDFLSSSLVAVECISFLVALIIISGIASEENYRITSLYGALFIMMLFSLACFVPLTLAMKFRAVRTRIHACFEKIFAATHGYGLSLPNLTRVVDSRKRLQDEVEDMRNTLHDIRLSMMDPGDFHDIYSAGCLSDDDDIVSSSTDDGDVEGSYPSLPRFHRSHARGPVSDGERNPMQRCQREVGTSAAGQYAKGPGALGSDAATVEGAGDRESRHSDWVDPYDPSPGSVAMTVLNKSQSLNDRRSATEGDNDINTAVKSDTVTPPPIPLLPPEHVTAAVSAESGGVNPSIPSFPPPPVPTSAPPPAPRDGITSIVCAAEEEETDENVTRHDDTEDNVPETFTI